MPPLREMLNWRRESNPSVKASPATPEGRAGSQPYTMAEWDEECFASFGEGRDPAPCPECGRTGFYGPRIDPTDRCYRQCRFCGFTQVVGELPVVHRPTAHLCAPWPQCARAPYVWWVAPEVESYLCPFCSKRVSVSEATVPRPVDDPDHPWWRVPQHRLRTYYLRFWENWEVTKGRVHL